MYIYVHLPLCKLSILFGLLQAAITTESTKSWALVIPLPSLAAAAASQVKLGDLHMGIAPGKVLQGPPYSSANLQEVFTTYFNLSKPRSSIFPGSFFCACSLIREQLGVEASPVITRSKGPLSLSLTLAFLKVG